MNELLLWKKLAVSFAVCFFAMTVVSFVLAHIAGQQVKVVKDQRIYIDNGCRGRYQGR